jgi:preprotein translocase subunit SecF
MKGGTSTSINYVDPEAVSIKERLEEMLGTAVQIQKEGSSGKITIEFSTPQELHSLLEKMTAMKPVSPIAPVVAPQEDSDLTFTL